MGKAKKTIKITEKGQFKQTVKALNSLTKNYRQSIKLEKLEKQLFYKRAFIEHNTFKNAPRILKYQFLDPPHTLRFSCVLNNLVDGDILTLSMYDVGVRFNSLTLDIREGFFYFYLEDNNLVPTLYADSQEIARPFGVEKRCHLFRLNYYKRRISIEVMSALSDFCAIKAFLKCVLFRYCQLKYPSFDSEKYRMDFHYLDKSTGEELLNPYEQIQPLKIKEYKSHPFLIKGDEEIGVTNLISLQLKTADLEKAASSLNCSITAFISALLSKTLIQYKNKFFPNKKNPVVLGLVLQGRDYLPTPSLGSFYVTDKIVLEDMPITELSKNLQSHLSMDNFKRVAGKAVNSGNAYYQKICPTFIKKTYHKHRRSHYTAIVYDAKTTQVNACWNKYVDRFEAVVGVTNKSPFAVAIESDFNITTICITSKLTETFIEYNFTKLLREYVAEISVDTNRRNNIL